MTAIEMNAAIAVGETIYFRDLKSVDHEGLVVCVLEDEFWVVLPAIKKVERVHKAQTFKMTDGRKIYLGAERSLPLDSEVIDEWFTARNPDAHQAVIAAIKTYQLLRV